MKSKQISTSDERMLDLSSDFVIFQAISVLDLKDVLFLFQKIDQFCNNCIYVLLVLLR